MLFYFERKELDTVLSKYRAFVDLRCRLDPSMTFLNDTLEQLFS